MSHRINFGGPSIQRWLATVLAADVVGYTRLMERDKDATVATWLAARETVIKPEIANHSGKFVNLTGDGFLVECPTVQDANPRRRCAALVMLRHYGAPRA